MNTTESNILIAEFMGGTVDDQFIYFVKVGNIFDDDTLHSSDLLFDSSWDWLMPVVEKIECLNNNGFDFDIFTDGIVITKYRDTETSELNEGNEIVRLTRAEISFDSKIEAVYNAVIEFIKWYNENSAKKEVKQA